MTTNRPDHWEDPVVLPEVSTPERVLVPFDGSKNSERALAWAAYVTARSDAELVVVVAYEQPLTMRGRGAAYVEAVRDDLAAEAMELATEAVELLKGKGLTARGVVVKGDVSHAILDTAEGERSDLIIIGRRGLSAEVGGMTSALDRARDILQGGVADKIVRHASVPVLVVG